MRVFSVTTDIRVISLGCVADLCGRSVAVDCGPSFGARESFNRVPSYVPSGLPWPATMQPDSPDADGDRHWELSNLVAHQY